jgi:pimeloyl-ACP methyl ester carboxylesterase
MVAPEDEAGEGTVGLDDGRVLGYREYGDPAGVPLLYLHGMPGSRLDPAPLDAEYRRLGVRLVAIERPGYGLSSARRSWGLLDWAADVAALANQLVGERFAVLGVSSGGKYAAACAYVLPDRVSRVAIVSGVGPPTTPRFREGLGRTDRMTMTLARRARPLALGYWRIARWMAAHRPQRFLEEIEKELSGPDRAVAADPQLREWALGTFREALRGGAAGVVEDAVIQARAWGFGLEQIQTPVQLWHGDRDEIVPLHHASYAAERIPDATLNVVEGTGHLLVLSRGAEITRALIT